jgi:predicted MFS family arabinose efflux permease
MLLSSRGLGLLAFVSMSILYFFAIFQRVGMAAIVKDLSKEFGTEASILGLMSGMYFYAYALAQIPVGLLLDRIGVRKTLTMLGVIACVGDLIFSLGSSILMLALGRGLIGFGVGGFYVSSLKALAFSYNPKRYATLVGALTSIGNLGSFAASLPLGVLSKALGWRESFLIIFFLMLLFVGIAWFTMKDKQDKPVSSGRSISSKLKTVFTNKELLKVAPSPLIVYGCFIAFQGLWVGSFLIDIYGMSDPTPTLFFMFIGIGFIISLPIVGLISDRIGKRKPLLLAGHVFCLVFWLAMSIFGNLLEGYQLIGLLFYLGFSFGFVAICMTIPVNLFPKEISGSAIAGLNIFGFIGGGFFQFFMGFILDSTYGGTHAFPSYQLIFVMGMVGVLVSLVFAVLFKERPLNDGNQHSRSRAATSAPRQQRTGKSSLSDSHTFS